MIGTLNKATSPERLLTYLAAERDRSGENRLRADLIFSNLGFDVAQIARHLRALTQLRPDVRKPLLHIVLAAAQDDRNLQDGLWRKIVRFWCQAMGYESYATYCHGNHVHIVASRVLSSLRLVSDQHDYLRSEIVIRALEERFNLTQTGSSHLVDPNVKTSHVSAPCQAELALAAKGTLSAKRYIQTVLVELTSQPIAISDLVAILAELNISTRTRFGEARNILGFSFSYRGYVFWGTSLGHSFSPQSLVKKGVTYDKNSEFEKLKRANAYSHRNAAVSANREAQHVDRERPPSTRVDVEASRGSEHGNSREKQNNRGRKEEAPKVSGPSPHIETHNDKTGTRPKASPDSMRYPSPDDNIQSFLHEHLAKQRSLIDAINWSGFSSPDLIATRKKTHR